VTPAGRSARPAVSREVRSPDWYRGVRRSLLAWYRRHARELPWRGTRDPFRVWVSEVMLQQTQVATVIGYYERFLAAFPNVQALAAADEAEVLRLWEGLGYYRRARQLHRAARHVVESLEGELPRDAAGWRALPGIGRYTAGAIVSLAFDGREPILEANTVRLWRRLLGWRNDPGSAASRAALWQAAGDVLPRRGSGEVNQALMDLGSQICTPRAPACDNCPLETLCPTRRLGLPTTLPASKVKGRAELTREAAVVVRKGRRVLLARRGEGGRWAGLWDFPRFALPKPSAESPRAAAADRRNLLAGLAEAAAIRVRWQRRLAVFQHSVTRFRITLECHEAEYVGGRPRGPDYEEFRWVKPAELADFPLSVTGRKLARLVAERPL
jgi:A/G-specific adenine glycosylase